MDKETGIHRKADGDYLYAVLNLSKNASQAEINERHRSLSLIFHPDKQVDTTLKVTATKEFLEIQKAYQGSDGLAVQWPPTLRFQTQEKLTGEKIMEVLDHHGSEMKRRRLKQIMSTKAKVNCSFDASPLFNPYFLITSRSYTSRIRERIQATRIVSQSLAYTIEKRLNNNTTFSFTGQTNPSKSKVSILSFVGTVRHQFSPRLNVLTSMTFVKPYPTRFEVNYEATGNIVNFKTALSPLLLDSYPPIMLSFSRQLFRSGPQRAKVDLNLTQSPSLSFFYISPPTLKINKQEDAVPPQLGPPTTLGIKYVAFERAYGVVFDRILPTLVAETSMTLVELSVRLKASIQLGFSGALYSLGAHWSSESIEAGSTLILNSSALVLQLEHIQAAKKAFDEDSDSRRERNAVESLLKDAVKKQLRHETEAEGLIIQEATYGVAESELGEGKDALSLDVKIPLQALVRKSQLHIPGGTSKTALQGFSDPAPFASKSLRIRYLFRGRLHYAEIPDYMPVVLPLSEHLVG
ncbi:DnaJ-like protein subfamily C member 11-like protein [Psilocybe cubensis]|uniref:DnaJ-like protein subfamily C member 11-like protein n=1 Tax=Psilocybe cubensis TaxID=181762 RepID=A0ACB8GRW9_PSICU|nr:DnaJ-like protein subfamily C member 11-like protein [Psilocybe cubensis]KAH9477784.1 DnaJ-like protein subfamily C member 11-like protein [Psilocybe cubensis]